MAPPSILKSGGTVDTSLSEQYHMSLNLRREKNFFTLKNQLKLWPVRLEQPGAAEKKKKKECEGVWVTPPLFCFNKLFNSAQRWSQWARFLKVFLVLGVCQQEASGSRVGMMLSQGKCQWNQPITDPACIIFFGLVWLFYKPGLKPSENILSQ